MLKYDDTFLLSVKFDNTQCHNVTTLSVFVKVYIYIYTYIYIYIYIYTNNITQTK